MKVVAVANQKGGVGKTTTAVNLATCLAAREQRVLLIDLDPQANATSGLGIEGIPDHSVYEPLVGAALLSEKIMPTRFDHLFLIPSDLDLAGAEVEVARLDDHLLRLRGSLQPLRRDGTFDYVLLDCPPSLGILMTNALAAADELLVPLQCEFFALDGLTKIDQVIRQINACGANAELRLTGILMTMFDSRTNLSQQVLADVRKHYPGETYTTVIPRTIRLGEAPSFGQPIIEYEPNGVGATAYRAMAAEFLRRHEPA